MLDCWTGMDILKALQDFRESAPDIITDFLMAISSIVFYMMLPLILFFVMYWFVDKRKGEFCMVNVITAYMMANFLKFIIREPRPYELDPEIKPVYEESSYSTPSAHTAIATSGYGSMVLVIKNNIWRIVLFAILSLIVFSRIYLGVHTPLDVILGLLVAVGVMAANYFLLEMSYRSDRDYYAIGIGYVVFFTATVIFIWSTMDCDYKNIALGSGFLLGLLVARLVERRYVGYEITETTTKNKVVLGFIGLIVAGLFIGIPYVTGVPALMFVGGFMAMIWCYAAFPYMMKNRISFVSKFV